MNICRIHSIKPDGKPWESQYGLMYPLYIVFADGAAGSVNSKTEVPPYKVGDEVGYEVTGKTPKGVPKLKIDRKADPATCRNTTPQDSNPELEAMVPPAPAAAPQKPQNPPQNHSDTAKGVHAATACWAVGKAVELVIAGKEQDIEGAARNLVAIQQRIERGETGDTIPF